MPSVEVGTVARFRRPLLVRTMVNNRFEQNVFEQNTEAGFQIHDPSRHTATDYFLTESFANANAGAGFKLDTTAGALIRGNHLYSNGVDIDINIASQALRIQSNCAQLAFRDRSCRLR